MKKRITIRWCGGGGSGRIRPNSVRWRRRGGGGGRGSAVECSVGRRLGNVRLDFVFAATAGVPQRLRAFFGMPNFFCQLYILASH